MVTLNNGLQVVGFILLCFASFLASEGTPVLALRRPNFYDTDDGTDQLSTGGMKSDIGIAQVKPMDFDATTFDHKSILSPSGPQSTENEDALPLEASDKKLLRNYLRRQHLQPSSQTGLNQYRIDVQELLNEEDPEAFQTMNFGSAMKNQVRASGRNILPLLQSQLPSDLPRADHFSQISNQSETSGPNAYIYPQFNNGIPMQKRLYGEQTPVKKWWGARYKPRPKMDRRAAQSKHYGCLKRCISIGKLHPIQCHTLC